MLTKHLLKVLVMSMLAAIGVMAVSASAAQAKWLILVNGKSLNATTLTGSINLGVMLVPGQLQIHCNSGTATAEVKLASEEKVLQGTGSALFSGCLVKDSTGKENTNCTVNSPGEPAGSIKATGSGVGSMSGSKTFATLESENFTEVLISGGLCPLDEFDATVNGSATLTLDNAESKEITHTVKLDDQELFYGENEALLHSGAGEPNPVTGSVKDVSGTAWAIQLVGL